jgi:predicted nucleic acid-binding Zn ribbon protein
MGAPGADLLGVVFACWDDIAGESLCRHVRPVSFRQGALVVAVDRPAWATEVRRLAPTLLARIAEVAGTRPERLDVVVRAGANSAAGATRGRPSPGPD